MTTKVTVDAHAGWDVIVHTRNGEIDSPPVFKRELVPAYKTRDFNIHSGMQIMNIEESGNWQKKPE